MVFNSIEYLCFFPIVTATYFLLPDKLKNIWLLLASYYFYMSWNVQYGSLLVLVTLVSYVGGMLIEKYRKKSLLVGCLAINLILLGIFKYANFIIRNINHALSLLKCGEGFDALTILLPMGISFYVFQAMGYLIDVWRGHIASEKRLVNFSLFLAFFPQLVAGPIERSGNLLRQFDQKMAWNEKRILSGLLLIGWGLFMKIVIAERCAIFVNGVYDDYSASTGTELILATFVFGIQIYCDFAGYSTMARGSARVLGFELMENFKSPYLASSCVEFWKCWHVSLTKWFTDYVYIPLGGSRCSTPKRYRNILLTFLLSGMWHGASWNYIAWGGLHGGYQIAEHTLGIGKKKKTRIQTLCGMAGTYLLVNFAWIFFRASSFTEAFLIIRRMFDDPFAYKVHSVMDVKDGVVLLLAVLLLFVVDWLRKYRGFNTDTLMSSPHLLLRWAVYLSLLYGIIIFGKYGSNYAITQFIYFQF